MSNCQRHGEPSNHFVAAIRRNSSPCSLQEGVPTTGQTEWQIPKDGPPERGVRHLPPILSPAKTTQRTIDKKLSIVTRVCCPDEGPDVVPRMRTLTPRWAHGTPQLETPSSPPPRQQK
ncbi:uncharacterized protein EI97DRAFT_50489 [Westerdykella ornata]|uniref:Uncharacterized protein n=1 Tax=Westerdykella ornata TaxID=318751 RepID=A0A6A6JHV6_WESOR|nr:uncharacterized protein EI97DRAFT_50489 [Westerdykella ornata]KAF2276141.1 hypothetical protein EI97DRAFT_50489 [Westerdykella ornata]